MSATSSSLDPVQTVIDILSGTAEADWPNGTKPNPIEDRWTSNRNEKRKRQTPAAYVYSPDIGTQEQFGRDADVKVKIDTIDVDVWARDSDTAFTVADDVVSILEDYWNDSQDKTQWNRIRPQSENDQRGTDSPETVMGRRHNQYILSPRVELHREASMGT